MLSDRNVVFKLISGGPKLSFTTLSDKTLCLRHAIPVISLEAEVCDVSKQIFGEQ